MRKMSGKIGKAVLAAALMLGVAVSPERASAADQVSFALNWIISGRNAGYFVALDKGFYSERGLDVTISRGRGSGDTLKRVAIGESTFGLVDSTSVVTGVANDDAPVKMIGMMYSTSAMAVLYTEQSGIETLNDLEGRAIARAASGAAANMWPTLLTINGVDQSSIEEVIATSSTNVPLLLSGQVDAVLDQSSYIGRYQKAVAPQGLEMKAMRFADFGLDLYGDAIIASDDTISESPGMVRNFLEATLAGNLWAFENPEEAVEILARYGEEVEVDVALIELLDMKSIALTEEAAENGYGYLDPARIAGLVDMIAEPFGIRRLVEPSEVMTLQFLQ